MTNPFGSIVYTAVILAAGATAVAGAGLFVFPAGIAAGLAWSSFGASCALYRSIDRKRRNGMAHSAVHWDKFAMAATLIVAFIATLRWLI